MTALLDAAIGELTDEQRLAVQHTGNFSLLARPGSGKTRVVGLRLALAAADQSRSIAVTSYTNVAVEEVHAVVARAGIVVGSKHYVGTLHGLLLDYIVRPHGHLVRDGKVGPLRIRHDDWVGGRGWPVVKLGGDRNKRVPISYFDWTADEQVVCRRRPPGFNYATVKQITELGAEEARKLKDKEMKQRGVITQSDAMFVALKVLSRSRLAAALAGRFDEIIVDEAQDTSDVQLACIEALRTTGVLRSLVIVADLEQSIYGFQGADPARCERLINKGGIEPLDLTRNFRSSQRICNVARHFTAREEADVAVGPHAKCHIDPEVLRFPANVPKAAVETFAAQLTVHGIPQADAVVLSRSRGLRDALNGPAEVQCNRTIRALGRLAAARSLARTLNISEVRAAEETLLWCIDDKKHLGDIPKDARRRLRAAVGTLFRELPATDGTLATWISAARPVLNSLLNDMVTKGHKLSHEPSAVCKALTKFEKVEAVTILGGAQGTLHAQTVHAVKGCSVDAVLMVVAPRSKRGDPAQLLTNLCAGGGDLHEREDLRIGFVALSRAQRYCAVALADSVAEDVHAQYVEMGFVPVVDGRSSR